MVEEFNPTDEQEKFMSIFREAIKTRYSTVDELFNEWTSDASENLLKKCEERRNLIIHAKSIGIPFFALVDLELQICPETKRQQLLKFFSKLGDITQDQSNRLKEKFNI